MGKMVSHACLEEVINRLQAFQGRSLFLVSHVSLEKKPMISTKANIVANQTRLAGPNIQNAILLDIWEYRDVLCSHAVPMLARPCH